MITIKSSLPLLKARCQVLFNEYIRNRDITGCSHFKCISCGQIKPKRLANAGHYYNIGHYDGLRFDEDNCHVQCIYCNKFLHGNLLQYRDNLLFKIGAERFEKLRIKALSYKRTGSRFSRFELKLKIDELKAKIKLQNEQK